MKRWAVGFISFMDNEMKIEIISAATWKTALALHAAAGGYEIADDELSDDMETAKQQFFDQDAMFDVAQIPALKSDEICAELPTEKVKWLDEHDMSEK